MERRKEADYSGGQSSTRAVAPRGKKEVPPKFMVKLEPKKRINSWKVYCRNIRNLLASEHYP
jgi:hypothetical protein